MLQLVAQDFDGCAPLSCIHVFLGNSVAILWTLRFVKVQMQVITCKTWKKCGQIGRPKRHVFVGKTEVKREIHWKFEVKKKSGRASHLLEDTMGPGSPLFLDLFFQGRHSGKI